MEKQIIENPWCYVCYRMDDLHIHTRKEYTNAVRLTYICRTCGNAKTNKYYHKDHTAQNEANKRYLAKKRQERYVEYEATHDVPSNWHKMTNSQRGTYMRHNK